MDKKELIGKYLPVLDGFVGLVDFMGDDESIEQAARVSYGKGTKKKRDTGSLINYLVRKRHSSPLEHGIVQFHIAMPIFVMRQFIRHRTLSVNEYSARYSECPDMFYLPDEFRAQDTKNKQGSLGIVECNKERVYEHYRAGFNLYKELLSQGVARELARIVLPLSTYTFFYVECDIRNWFHFMGLRSDSHAQKEIQVYSNAIGAFIKELFPLSFDSWLKHDFESRSFTVGEINFLGKYSRQIISKDVCKTYNKFKMDPVWKTDSEIDDFLKKINPESQADKFQVDWEQAKEASHFENLLIGDKNATK